MMQREGLLFSIVKLKRNMIHRTGCRKILQKRVIENERNGKTRKK